MVLLEVKDIKKSFGGVDVLRGISFDLSEGQAVSVLGPSGSGKSTLLRCITMLETADGGEVTYCGRKGIYTKDGRTVYAPKAELREIKKSFGLVFQSFNLFPHYTVMQNITDAPVHVLGVPRDEAEARAKELIAKLGLEGREGHYPYQLSGGQQQRVAIARALAMQPKMLFFDEPTSALDPELTAEILSVLKELAREKMTMMIVTHEIDFARSISDHVIFMDGGVIAEEGRPEDVIDHPSSERTRAFLKKLES
ncbi:MAG: amino acid ABC transporter ATP-binding protein [Oscillospiraceae bacterium]|nr:amino acid ABC transporter ATP-binding protein [Oscillospiraceae bacterium]